MNHCKPTINVQGFLRYVRNVVRVSFSELCGPPPGDSAEPGGAHLGEGRARHAGDGHIWVRHHFILQGECFYERSREK